MMCYHYMINSHASHVFVLFCRTCFGNLFKYFSSSFPRGRPIMHCPFERGPTLIADAHSTAPTIKRDFHYTSDVHTACICHPTKSVDKEKEQLSQSRSTWRIYNRIPAIYVQVKQPNTNKQNNNTTSGSQIMILQRTNDNAIRSAKTTPQIGIEKIYLPALGRNATTHVCTFFVVALCSHQLFLLFSATQDFWGRRQSVISPPAIPRRGNKDAKPRGSGTSNTVSIELYVSIFVPIKVVTKKKKNDAVVRAIDACAWVLCVCVFVETDNR